MAEKQIVAYLLGRLPEADTERLDERSITDDAFVARMRDVENDLVDDYIKGSLTGDTLNAFESTYLASPKRREKVEFARSLRQATRPAVTASRRWTGWSSRMLAIAATLVLVLSGAFFIERSDRSDRSDRSRQGQSAVADNQTQGTAPQVATAGSPAVAPSSIGSAPAQSSAGAAPVAVPLVMLEPETRAATRALPTLTLPAGVTEASFSLKLEAADLVAYSAALKDPATGSVTWRSQWMSASGSGDKARLLVTVPVDLLKPQHYTIDVSGRSTTGATEVVGSYAFEVTRR